MASNKNQFESFISSNLPCGFEQVLTHAVILHNELQEIINNALESQGDVSTKEENCILVETLRPARCIVDKLADYLRLRTLNAAYDYSQGEESFDITKMEYDELVKLSKTNRSTSNK